MHIIRQECLPFWVMVTRYRLTILEEYQEMQDSFGNHFLPAADLVSIESTVCLELLPVRLWRRCICIQMHLSIATGGFAYSSTEKYMILWVSVLFPEKQQIIGEVQSFTIFCNPIPLLGCSFPWFLFVFWGLWLVDVALHAAVEEPLVCWSFLGMRNIQPKIVLVHFCTCLTQLRSRQLFVWVILIVALFWFLLHSLLRLPLHQGLPEP